jgi:hypothetical protein
MDKVELLYDHYKDTYTLHLEMKKKRDAFFVMLCIGMTLLFCFLINPVGIFESILKMTQEYFSFDLPFQITILQSFFWIIILYLFMRYIQTSIYIERQYKYIEQLENSISNDFSIEFNRESKNYENKYPIVLTIIHKIYVWGFPILSILLIILKIILEKFQNYNIISFIFNLIIALVIIILNIFYLIFIHKK